MRRGVKAVLCLLLIGGALAGAEVARAQSTPGGEWLNYNNGLHGQRYSPLKQIDASNAARLGTVCRVQIDGPGSYHGGLIVQGDTIYTGTPRTTVALDAATCAKDLRPERGHDGA